MEKINIKDLPIDLQYHLDNYTIETVIQGRIGDQILKLINREKVTLYLKMSCSEITQNEMQKEAELLQWLKGKEIYVPTILNYSREHEVSYMLITEVAGQNAHIVNDMLSKEKVIELSAKGLKAIHSIDYTSIPRMYTHTLEDELHIICKDIEQKRVDEIAFQKACHKTPTEAIEDLIDRRGIFNADIFTHGDYCLPNVLIDHRQKYGFIDWSQAGVGDSYRDIAPMLKSIKRNFGEGYEELFCGYYGIAKNDIDYEKIDYYNLIDEFYYAKIK